MHLSQEDSRLVTGSLSNAKQIIKYSQSECTAMTM